MNLCPKPAWKVKQNQLPGSITKRWQTIQCNQLVNYLERKTTVLLVPLYYSSFSFSISSFHSFCLLFFLWSSGWGEWTEWGDCDEEGLQHRTRRCGEEQEAEASLCQGNITQSRPCQPHEVPGKRLLFLINCWNKFGVYSKLLQTVADISWKNPVRVTQKFNQTQ